MATEVLLSPQPSPLLTRPNLTTIGVEPNWREPHVVDSGLAQRGDTLLVARWTHCNSSPVEVSSEGSDVHHCIGVSLTGTSLSFMHAGRQLVNGRVASGTVQVSAPATPVSALFRSTADIVHVFVPQNVLQECFEDLFQRTPADDVLLSTPDLIVDPTLERLGQALAVAQTNDPVLGKIFVESVSLAIVSRLVCRQYAGAGKPNGKVTPLPKWRLKRLVDYIDAHLAEGISLADMASTCGLTRMHFAAQFRAATGRTPHEYLLRCRIEHAKDLLQRPDSTVLQVALSCGFRSQAHFSTVFKRLVGHSPLSWRTMTSPVASRPPIR
jgi:AraC family transcriptional regulator